MYSTKLIIVWWFRLIPDTLSLRMSYDVLICLGIILRGWKVQPETAWFDYLRLARTPVDGLWHPPELQLLWGKNIETEFDYVGLGELDRSCSLCFQTCGNSLSPGILSIHSVPLIHGEMWTAVPENHLPQGKAETCTLERPKNPVYEELMLLIRRMFNPSESWPSIKKRQEKHRKKKHGKNHERQIYGKYPVIPQWSQCQMFFRCGKTAQCTWKNILEPKCNGKRVLKEWIDKPSVRLS